MKPSENEGATVKWWAIYNERFNFDPMVFKAASADAALDARRQMYGFDEVKGTRVRLATASEVGDRLDVEMGRVKSLWKDLRLYATRWCIETADMSRISIALSEGANQSAPRCEVDTTFRPVDGECAETLKIAGLVDADLWDDFVRKGPARLMGLLCDVAMMSAHQVVYAVQHKGANSAGLRVQSVKAFDEDPATRRIKFQFSVGVAIDDQAAEAPAA